MDHHPIGSSSIIHLPIGSTRQMKKELFICGDIGGTNTRFALYEVAVDGAYCSKPDLLICKKYHNEQFASFKDILRHFLHVDALVQTAPLTACFAVAGPVKGNSVRFTNRESWSIDGDIISSEFNIAVVRLVNDFLAVGYGILTLNEETECITLQKGQKDCSAPIACIGAGTGLGECFLTPNAEGAYSCFPSEGGHAEFAPRSELEVELLQYLKSKFGQQNRISVERIVSGTGLANVYEFLSVRFPDLVDPLVHSKIENAGDFKGAVIATSVHNELCRRTMEIFTTAYGSEAGVAGLKWLPYGGLYLTGGLTPKNIDWIKNRDGLFMDAYMDKGRVSGMLSTIPVYAVMVEDLGERGAEYVALDLLKSRLASSVSLQVPVKVPEHSDSTGFLSSPWAIALATASLCAVAFAWTRK